MKKEIISFFEKNATRSFKSKEIAKKLHINSEKEYSDLKSQLHQLYEKEFLSKNGKRYKLNSAASENRITGELQINQGGFGFVVPKNKKTGDIFIASRNLNVAFSGDLVEVALFAKQKGKNLEGQIINVLKRKRREIIGTLSKTNSFYFVKPDEPGIHRDIYIDPEKLSDAKKGDKVIAGNIIWNNPMLNPEGEIVEVIGKSGSQEAEAAAIAREFNLPYKFSPKTLTEAEKIDSVFTAEEISRRIDFRNKNVFTIDPEDAKDFDDALSIEELSSGNYSVGVHIADVSHYVKKNSNLDKEAARRGNSVYLVGQVIPMLPEKLSNNICSLIPLEDRLTYSVIIELTKGGKVVKYEIKKSVINSKRRFTYSEAQEIIESGTGDYADEILTLNVLAQALKKKRMREGSIDFYSLEVKFELDHEGRPVSIILREIKESNNLIEEFMLLANKIVAEHIARAGNESLKPFVYRIHDLPDREKIEEFARFVKSLGFSFNPNASPKSNQFRSLLEQIKGHEEEALINELAIRSMAKAVYSAQNIGHYGLGFKFYTHFTSPIRRYSDLMVHRLLYNYLESRDGTNYTYKQLEEISEHISQCERDAAEAERLSVKQKQIEYLKDHIGEEFHAVISGITHFGIFVKLTDNLAEGLVRLRDLEGDFYIYDEKKYSLIGRKSKKQFRLGDKILVQLVRADSDKYELDFLILE
jgi:ribonuclease R